MRTNVQDFEGCAFNKTEHLFQAHLIVPAAAVIKAATTIPPIDLPKFSHFHSIQEKDLISWCGRTESSECGEYQEAKRLQLPTHM